MANGVNRITILGNLGAKPELRTTKSGKVVCEMRVATNEAHTDVNGVKREHVEWHKVVCWGKRGEACAKYLEKGRQVFIEGMIRTRTYDAQVPIPGSGGQTLTVKRYATEIICTNVQFLGNWRAEQNYAQTKRTGEEKLVLNDEPHVADEEEYNDVWQDDVAN